ncbi:MAG: hypothetical protein ACLVG9_00655 [Eubacteriales bacterium]
MITLCKIDGTNYDVLVTAIEEVTEVVEGENSGTSLYRQREIRDIMGIKYAHNVTFSPDNDPEVFDALFQYLFGNVRESVIIEVVHNQTTIIYEAAYSTGSRRVAYINDDTNTVGWDELTVEFRSIETIVQPNEGATT